MFISLLNDYLLLLLIVIIIPIDSSLAAVTVMIESKTGENSLKPFAENFLSRDAFARMRSIIFQHSVPGDHFQTRFFGNHRSNAFRQFYGRFVFSNSLRSMNQTSATTLHEDINLIKCAEKLCFREFQNASTNVLSYLIAIGHTGTPKSKAPRLNMTSARCSRVPSEKSTTVTLWDL